MTKLKKIIIIFWATIIFISPCLQVISLASFDNDSLISSNEVVMNKEKIICDATIDEDFKDDSVIVTLKDDNSTDFSQLTKEDFQEIKVKNVKNLTSHLESLVKSVRLAASKDTTYISASSDTQTMKKLKDKTGYADKDLINISQNYNRVIRIELENKGKQNVLDAIKELEKRDDVLIAGPNYIRKTCSVVPDDSDATEQWAIDVIDLNESWQITTGSSTIKVGILDTGIDCDHPDLIDNINTVDSRNFLNQGNATTDPCGDGGHGTGVAGVIGAVGNNTEGIAGICWNVSLVNLRVLPADEDGSVEDVIEAVEYAIGTGIPILNLSLGSEEASDNEREIIDAYPGLAICSAGNYGTNGTNKDNDDAGVYPASYDCENIISVAATTSDDRMWEDSFYGATTVDLGAPGHEIKTTTNDGDTASKSGTSMAAPHVAGVAALLMSKYPKHESMSADDYYLTIKDMIVYTVDKVPSLEGKCEYGGRLNAYSALRYYDQCYIVRYNANGGEGIMADTRVFYETSTKTKTNVFTREGYDFDCWYIQRSTDNKWRYKNYTTGESGWYTEGQQPTGFTKYRYGNGVTVATTIDVPGAVITFHAQWKKYFTIKYDSDGGQGSMLDTQVYYGVSTPTKSNEFTYYGGEFKYWYAQRESDGKWKYQNSSKSQSGWYSEGSQPSGWIKYQYEDGCSVSNESSVAGDVITFYAQWDKYYTVIYKSNGGTGSMGSSTFYFGTPASLPSNKYTKSGYGFDCWYAKRYSDNKWKYQNASGTRTGWCIEGEQPSGWVKYRYEDEATINETNLGANDIVHLYAQWKQCFTIKYDANGGYGTMADTIVDYGVSKDLRLNSFERNNYAFSGWHAYRQSDGKWKYMNSNDSSQTGWYTDGQQPSGWIKYLFEDGETVSTISNIAGDTIRLYAQWDSSYTIVYNPNGASGDMQNTIARYGIATQFRENTFIWNNYEFVGWTIKRSSDNKWMYFNTNTAEIGWYTQGQQPEYWEKCVYSDESSILIYENMQVDTIMLYAQWRGYYCIQFDANGGEGVMSDIVVYIDDDWYIDPIQLPAGTFTREGYEFGGWYVYDTAYDAWAYSYGYNWDYAEWYSEGDEPEGYYKCVYEDQIYFNVSSDVPTTYILYAVWWEI